MDGEELFVLARLDLEQGRIEAGLLKLKRALVEEGAPAEVRLETARVYAQLGLRKKAQSHFKTYLEQKPDDVDARFQLGMALFEDNQSSTALLLWDQVLKSSPQYPPALFYLALAAAQAGKTGEARQQLKSLMQSVAPDNLYFGKASDLLKALDAAPQEKQDSVRVIAPGAAYRTEH